MLGTFRRGGLLEVLGLQALSVTHTPSMMCRHPPPHQGPNQRAARSCPLHLQNRERNKPFLLNVSCLESPWGNTKQGSQGRGITPLCGGPHTSGTNGAKEMSRLSHKVTPEGSCVRPGKNGQR